MSKLAAALAAFLFAASFGSAQTVNGVAGQNVSGTFSNLTLGSDPTSNMQAATKQYVDNHAGGASAGATAGTVQTTNGSGGFTASNNATILNALPIQEYSTVTRPPLATWFQALHNCQNQVVNVMIYGDSRSIADNTNASNSSFGVPTVSRWVDLLRSYLQGVCPSHGTGLVPVISNTNVSTAIPNYDNWSFPGTLATNPSNATGPYQQGTNGHGVAAVNGGDVLTFTSPIPYDHLNTYCESGVGGTWSIAVDGSTVGTCGISGGSDIATLATSSAFTLGTHTATFTCVTGPCGIYGAEGTAGSVGVSVHNVAVGSSAAEWLGLAPATQMAYSDLIPGGHHLDIIQYIANEPGIGYSTSSFQTALTNIITHDAALSSGAPSVLLVAPMQDGIVGQGPFYPIIKTVALALNTAFVDFRDREGAAQIASLYGPDTFHENTKGNAEEFSMIFGSIMDIPMNAPIRLTTSGSSGPASLNSGLLNIPNYGATSGGGAITNITGTVTVSGCVVTNGLCVVSGSSTSAVSFSSIPSTYNHLLLKVWGRADDANTAEALYLRFNGDSGANYDDAYAGGGTVTDQGKSAALTSGVACNINAANTIANLASQIDLAIDAYAQTAFWRNWDCLSGNANGAVGAPTNEVYHMAGDWRNTANAINQITLTDGGGGHFVAGSSFSVYAIQ